MGLDRVLRVERPLTVRTGDGFAVHVFGLNVPLKAVPILDFLVANVTSPISRFKLFHLKVSPH